MSQNTDTAPDASPNGIMSKFRFDMNGLGMVFIIIALCIVFSWLNPNFYSGTNLRNVARQTAILGIVACGQTVVILSGGFDLSAGMVIGLISVSSSLILIDHGLVIGCLSAIGIGLAIGAFNGIMIAKAGLPAFIATLAMYSAARGLALIISGGLPITDMPFEFGWIGAGQILTMPVPALISLLVFLLCSFLMVKTRFGRHVYAIGGNQDSALFSGINVDRVKILVWSLHGGLVGLAALVLTSRAVSAHATLGEGMELESIAATVIGGTALGRGRGSILNTFLGVVVMAILTNGLNLINVSSYYQMVANGIIIATAVYVDQFKRVKS